MDSDSFFLGCALTFVSITVCVSTSIVVVCDANPVYIIAAAFFALMVAGGIMGVRLLLIQPGAPPPAPQPPQEEVRVIVADVEEPPSVIGTAEDSHTVVIVQNPRTASSA